MNITDLTDLANALTDWEFETILRIRARSALAQIETFTSGPTSYNTLTFHFSSERGYWHAQAGRTYGANYGADGEVLAATAANAVAIGHMADGAKLALLAPPEPATPVLPAATPIEDDEIPF